MDKLRNSIAFIIAIFGILVLSSCDKKEKTGFVTFGANYDIINCASNVTIYVDNSNIGTLTSPTHSITKCGEKSNITKELTTGEHTYKVEIRSEMRSDCSKDIQGTFVIDEDECEKIFIDYNHLFNNQSDCDEEVIISQQEYQNASNDSSAIIDINIDGDCLNVKLGASGCDGNSWIIKLIDSGNIAESYPCQRTLKLSLDNKEECLAFISKEVSFDIKNLRIVGDDKVILNVGEKSILYEY